MRILAVDDDEFVLEMLSILVPTIGYKEIYTAASAGHALELITAAREPFQCILLDIRMPVMDGIEFCDLLRRLPDFAACPIIMVTAMADKSYVAQAYEAGATDYIIKPFDVNVLSMRLAAAVKSLEVA
ncbi:two-component system response regulator [Oceaniovalibus sp. ACAM 378]|uniref:response regulator n=1 Tax=Oceaniovalibus sp. ACAM 378 TaxID=2599923 RepID=UPI0011D9ED42|nr:response regulator [Oceaniovalibus sp. ACAM 378]TYB83395.1 response regulator [Oceaniovalibus sp. ACAM 378]